MPPCRCDLPTFSSKLRNVSLHRVKQAHALARQGFGSEIALILDGGLYSTRHEPVRRGFQCATGCALTIDPLATARGCEQTRCRDGRCDTAAAMPPPFFAGLSSPAPLHTSRLQAWATT